ncbi:MAG: translation elongation factor Ts, partial [bacterium]
QTLTGGAENLKEQALEGGQGTVNDLIIESIGKMGENLQLVNASRMAVDGEGTLGGYVHSNKKIGVLVALGSAKAIPASDLETLANDLAMHIAASQVSAIHGDDIDPAVIDKEKEIYIGQAKESGKPENIVEKIVQGRLDKFVNEVSLMNQPFVKDPDNTISQLLAETGKELGTELTVQRFEKFEF